MTHRLTEEEQETLATHDFLAPTWDAMNPIRRRDENFADFFQRIPRGGILLDSGCATGSRDVELVVAEGLRYVGVDLSERMLAIGSETTLRRKAIFVRMDVHDLAFRSQIFDGFLAIGLFRHIHRENAWKVLAGHRRVLKPGGAGLISLVPGNRSEMHRSSRTGKRTLIVSWRPEDFADALQWAGLSVLRFRQYNQLLMYTVGKER